MYRKHCFCFCFIVSIFSITNGDNFNKSPLNTPAQMLSYFDEHFASLTLDLTRRIEELESKQAEDAHRIDILEQLHVRDVGQMMAIRHAVDVLRTENGHLRNQVDFLQKQLHTQISITKTNAATTVLENNISDVVSHTSQVILGNISSGWTEASNATETISKPRLRRNLNGNKNWEKNLNMKSLGSESTDSSLTTENTRKKQRAIIDERLDSTIPNIGLGLRESQTDASNEAVAFYAILDHENHDISQGSTIVFENIVSNEGGHYSQFTGMFTIPSAGIYVFHWNVKSDYNSWVISELVRNGSALGTDLSTYPNSGSATAIAVLERGDRIWVRITSHTAGAEVQPTFTTFSGFLLQP